MGALFAAVFFLVLAVIGILGAVAGIVGLVIGIKKQTSGDPFGKVLTIVFAVVLSLGIIITLIPMGFFSFIVIVNTVPPDGFVETAIVIEEDGYQDTQFTADGVVYECLGFTMYDTNAVGDPVFTYKTAGFLNGSQCGNYYAVENNQGFDLVSDEFGALFSPVGERERVIAYYTDFANLHAYYDDWDGREVKLSDDANEVVQRFVATLDSNTVPSDLEYRELEYADEFEVKFICKEDLVYADAYWFLALDDTLYYVYHSDFTEGDSMAYHLLHVPSEVAQALLEIHTSD